MGFRDDNEALRAKVRRLEAELGDARAELARLRPTEEDVPAALLPVRRAGYERRVRLFQTYVDDALFRKVRDLLSTGASDLVNASTTNGRLEFRTKHLDVYILPGRENKSGKNTRGRNKTGKGDDEAALLVFDEVQRGNYTASVATFAGMFFAGLGATLDNEPAIGVGLFVIAAAATLLTLRHARTKMLNAQTRRDELFDALCTLLEGAQNRVRPPPAPEFLEPEDEEELHASAVSSPHHTS